MITTAKHLRSAQSRQAQQPARTLVDVAIFAPLRGTISNPEGTMGEHEFHDIWKGQCAAARSVRAQHGILSALDYLIGEKLLTYAETAVARPEFRSGATTFRRRGP
jgi:hypothetical protein